MSSPDLNIIIPCFNPPLGWEKTVLSNYLELQKKLAGKFVGLILINDGSTKNVTPETVEFLKKNILDFTYIEYSENKGKGYALREGVKVGASEYTIFTDVDFPYELKSILAIFHSLLAGNDVALGNRDHNYYVKTPLTRKFISKLFRKLMALLLKLNVTDTQCGLKGFNQKGKKEFLKTTINRFLFDLEFVKRCSENKNIKIEPVSVKLKPNVVFSQVKITILLTEIVNFIKVLIFK